MGNAHDQTIEMNSSEVTDAFTDLMDLARSGSNESLGRLLESQRNYLLWLANRELFDEVRAKGGGSDMVQQTFLAAKQAFDQFRGELPDDFRAWLRTILLNNVAHFHRGYLQTKKRNVQAETSLQSATMDLRLARSVEPSPSSYVRHGEDRQQLSKALESLSPEYQQVIRLRYWERLTFGEIGQRLNRSADAARKLWSRATRQLEREFNQ